MNARDARRYIVSWRWNFLSRDAVRGGVRARVNDRHYRGGGASLSILAAAVGVVLVGTPTQSGELLALCRMRCSLGWGWIGRDRKNGLWLCERMATWIVEAVVVMA